MERMCLIKGKDLKRIIKCTYGALIMHKGIIMYFSPLFGTINGIDACRPSNARGFLFTSHDLSWLKRLSDDEIYELVYDDNSHLEVKNYRTGETIMEVPGILVPLP